MADLLGTFEQSVLLSILNLGEGAYGRAILNGVQESLQRRISAGAVYSTLERLEASGPGEVEAGSGHGSTRGPRAQVL
jgi:PadR family transcriptional regulator, regulatory protein PadR